jgi:hypothetical protein
MPAPNYKIGEPKPPCLVTSALIGSTAADYYRLYAATQLDRGFLGKDAAVFKLLYFLLGQYLT